MDKFEIQIQIENLDEKKYNEIIVALKELFPDAKTSSLKPKENPLTFTIQNTERWLSYPEYLPAKYGRYEIYRQKCDKQHYLTWNGIGWSSDGNTVTHFREIIKPIIEPNDVVAAEKSESKLKKSYLTDMFLCSMTGKTCAGSFNGESPSCKSCGGYEKVAESINKIEETINPKDELCSVTHNTLEHSFSGDSIICKNCYNYKNCLDIFVV